MKKVVYVVYDKGELVGEFSSLEVSGLTGIPQKRVASYASSGAAYHGRYTLESIMPIKWDAMAKEWDEARLRILEPGR